MVTRVILLLLAKRMRLLSRLLNMGALQTMTVQITLHAKTGNALILALRIMFVLQMLYVQSPDTTQYALVLMVTLVLLKFPVPYLRDLNAQLIQNALITLHVSEKNA
jgi:hypothetical protein